MPKLKAIFYPSKEGDVGAFYDNAYQKLTTGGLATKYGIPAPDVTTINTNNGNIPTVINDALAAELAAKDATTTKSQDLATSKFDLLNVFGIINRSSILDEADADALGMRQSHTPPNPDTAQPKITHTTSLPDQNILDWVKGPWFGVSVYASYDGTDFTKLDKDNRSPYEDKRVNRTPHVPEKRYYMLRYFDNKGVEIGLNSLVTMLVTDINAI